MKRIGLIIISLQILISVFGQKTEFGCSFNSGLFSYAGKSAVGTSFINVDDNATTGYTNNPYGSKNGLCYGVSLNLKRITKIHFIYGMDIGYENLRSMVSINEVFGLYDLHTYQYAATGQTYLNTNFLNFNPFIGYRLNIKTVSFDLTGGIDYGYILSSNENGNAISTYGVKYTTSTSMNRKNISSDIRQRIQISAKYKKYGLYIGYSYGLSDYLNHMESDSYEECYSRLIRFGITYQIK